VLHVLTKDTIFSCIKATIIFAANIHKVFKGGGRRTARLNIAAISASAPTRYRPPA
jgi:hypothetical protein